MSEDRVHQLVVPLVLVLDLISLLENLISTWAEPYHIVEALDEEEYSVVVERPFEQPVGLRKPFHKIEDLYT